MDSQQIISDFLVDSHWVLTNFAKMSQIMPLVPQHAIAISNNGLTYFVSCVNKQSRRAKSHAKKSSARKSGQLANDQPLLPKAKHIEYWAEKKLIDARLWHLKRGWSSPRRWRKIKKWGRSIKSQGPWHYSSNSIRKWSCCTSPTSTHGLDRLVKAGRGNIIDATHRQQGVHLLIPSQFP